MNDWGTWGPKTDIIGKSLRFTRYGVSALRNTHYLVHAPAALIRLRSVRPLVRYVDDEQAVVDVHFTLYPLLTIDGSPPPERPAVEVLVEIDAEEGFHDEGGCKTRLDEAYRGSVRFDIVRPSRWWPSGLGEQSLYRVSVSVGLPGGAADRKTVTLGMASVREDTLTNTYNLEQTLLVHGQVLAIEHLIHVDKISENRLLPATGGSLLMVRDHFGTDTLYDAADRAGILLLQCVPIPADDRAFERWVETQVDRIAPHPSLAGWFVGHLGEMRDDVAERIKTLDPSHAVFRELPLDPAA